MYLVLTSMPGTVTEGDSGQNRCRLCWARSTPSADSTAEERFCQYCFVREGQIIRVSVGLVAGILRVVWCSEGLEKFVCWIASWCYLCWLAGWSLAYWSRALALGRGDYQGSQRTSVLHTGKGSSVLPAFRCQHPSLDRTGTHTHTLTHIHTHAAACRRIHTLQLY